MTHLLRDDKAESAAAEMTSRASVCWSERLEESREHVLVDANSSVLDLKEQIDAGLGLLLLRRVMAP